MAKWDRQSASMDAASFKVDKRLARRRRLRMAVLLAAGGVVVALGALPAYRWLREFRLDRILESAETAARLEDWGTARDKARSVLLARHGDLGAVRVLHKALSRIGDPRAYVVALNLFLHPHATPHDQLDALRVLAVQAPQAIAASAFASLGKERQAQTASVAAITPLLRKRGEVAAAERMLRAAPELAANPDAQLELLCALCATPAPERVAEARTIFAGLASRDASPQALQALLVLGETPGGLAAGEPLPADLPAWVQRQPKASAIHHLFALHPQLDEFPSASQDCFDRAIDRFLAVNPGTLGSWLVRHKQAARVVDLLAEPAKTNAGAYIARLHALLREQRLDEAAAALAEPPKGVDRVELEVARAAAASVAKDPAAEAAAWDRALYHAAFDQTRNRFLELGQFAANLGATRAVEDSWVAAVRVGWGPIPFYQDLQPVYASLVRQGRTEDLLAMCRSLMRYEPRNPDLANNYHYLALLHGNVAPATAARTLGDLCAAHPERPEFRASLAMALLMDHQPAEALAQLPKPAAAPRVPPQSLRAIEACALLLQGDTARGRDLFVKVDWKPLLRSERAAFRRLLAELAIKDLPLPEADAPPAAGDEGEAPEWRRRLEQQQQDRKEQPAAWRQAFDRFQKERADWRKAIEQMEQERAKDVLPTLPPPDLPGAEPPEPAPKDG